MARNPRRTITVTAHAVHDHGPVLDSSPARNMSHAYVLMNTLAKRFPMARIRIAVTRTAAPSRRRATKGA